MTESQHYMRINDLRSMGISESDIVEIIYREYGLRLKISDVKNSQSYSLSSLSSVSFDSNFIVQIIQDILEESKTPLSSAEISRILKEKYFYRVTKKEIFTIINDFLSDSILFNSNNLTYTFKNNNYIIDNIQHIYSLSDVLDSILYIYKDVDIISAIKEKFRSHLLVVSTGIHEIDYLIKSIVKDNRITECEEIFLRSKAKEFGYSGDIIATAKHSLESNNPYLDKLIHIIFDDGLITNDELAYLREKTEENGFSSAFVNERFWTIGLSEYTQHLLKLDPLDKVIVLFFIYNKINDNIYHIEQFIQHLDFYQFEDISSIGDANLERISKMLNNSLKDKYGYEYNYANFILDNIIIKKDWYQVTKELQNNNTDLSKFIKVLNQERLRIGSPDVNLLFENVCFRLENNLWD